MNVETQALARFSEHFISEMRAKWRFTSVDDLLKVADAVVSSRHAAAGRLTIRL